MEPIPASKNQKAAIAIQRAKRFKPRKSVTWPGFEDWLIVRVGKTHISDLTEDEAQYVIEELTRGMERAA